MQTQPNITDENDRALKLSHELSILERWRSTTINALRQVLEKLEHEQDGVIPLSFMREIEKQLDRSDQELLRWVFLHTGFILDSKGYQIINLQKVEEGFSAEFSNNKIILKWLIRHPEIDFFGREVDVEVSADATFYGHDEFRFLTLNLLQNYCNNL